PRFTLKDANTFLLADALGDVQGSDDGLFTDDTRMLSRYELEVAGRHPSLLGAAINQENTLFTAHLTNRPLPAVGDQSLPQGVIHIERNRFLCDGCLHEQLKFTNFSDEHASVPIRVSFAADFVDIFEVQGQRRAARGEYLIPEVDQRAVRLAYRGRDERVRATCIRFSLSPAALSAQAAEFRLELPRGGIAELFVAIGSDPPEVPGREPYDAAAQRLNRSMQQRVAQSASIGTSGRLFNLWLDKSRSDLALLTTSLPTGPYPYAGIPWFATQFGRDAIITALQTLWVNPQLGAGVLAFLASTQAHEESAFRDSQPGKIMHEMRRGEMAALREVPFGCYYGGVDSTPLFVMLAGAYERRTGDRALVDQIWKSLQAAIAWIEQRMQASPTGFLDYARGEKTGLVNQAWKDSHDSMFHADGSFPRGPLAVVEVQGYVYAAFEAMSELAAVRGEQAAAERWSERASTLREAIERYFWVPDLNFYAIALDGDGTPSRVCASNAGHILYCGVPSPERAAAVTARLLSPRGSSGWGIRTLAAGQARYNPMSYHNGSVWPHDTALCAAGIAQYAGRAPVVQILGEIFEAAHHFGMRLPELYCGFARVEGQGPAPYPVACLPQAWSAGAAFMLLQAVLGIRIDGRHEEVHIQRPMLPIGIESLRVSELAVGEAHIDLEFYRVGTEVVVAPLRHAEHGVRVLAHL
ncbi:MAG TPA: amylo-alpha-1,6-glucosidase, partial [Candidatus Dormibacteraeota bacterium]|nr:amylo-alpha-1,6-glucosidase [Candidatus Dormibacteraeota bacterium]